MANYLIPESSWYSIRLINIVIKYSNMNIIFTYMHIIFSISNKQMFALRLENPWDPRRKAPWSPASGSAKAPRLRRNQATPVWCRGAVGWCRFDHEKHGGFDHIWPWKLKNYRLYWLYCIGIFICNKVLISEISLWLFHIGKSKDFLLAIGLLIGQYQSQAMLDYQRVTNDGHDIVGKT